jgi:hypothetical protein
MENIKISELRKMSVDKIIDEGAFAVISDDDFIGYFIVPITGMMKSRIEQIITEAELVRGSFDRPRQRIGGK